MSHRAALPSRPRAPKTGALLERSRLRDATVVRDGDEEALLAESLKLATDPAARQSLGQRGRAHASARYDIRQIVPVLAQEYKQVSSMGLTAPRTDRPF